MLGVKELTSFILLPLLALVVVSSSNDGTQDLYERSYNEILPFERRIRYLIETKRSVDGINNLIQELQSLSKRTGCSLDGGLSASCNHKDAVEAGEHHRFLASSFAPGRRKRRSLQTLLQV